MSDQILQVVNQHYTFTDASLKRSVCLLAFCRHFALQLQSVYLNLGDFAELTSSLFGPISCASYAKQSKPCWL